MIDLIDKKDIKKANEELIDLHKRVILNYLISKDVGHLTRKKFFHIYDFYIKSNNIRQYFHVKVDLFVYALITDKLKQIGYYKKYTKRVKRISRKGKKIKYV